jgi:hypothetical protein
MTLSTISNELTRRSGLPACLGLNWRIATNGKILEISCRDSATADRVLRHRKQIADVSLFVANCNLVDVLVDGQLYGDFSAIAIHLNLKTGA